MVILEQWQILILEHQVHKSFQENLNFIIYGCYVQIHITHSKVLKKHLSVFQKFVIISIHLQQLTTLHLHSWEKCKYRHNNSANT